jgi:hypothetical protein
MSTSWYFVAQLSLALSRPAKQITKRTADTRSYTPPELPSLKTRTALPDPRISPHATRSKASTLLLLNFTNRTTQLLRTIIHPSNNIIPLHRSIFTLPHTSLSKLSRLKHSIIILRKAVGSSGPLSMLNLSLRTITTHRTKGVISDTNTSQVRPGRSRSGEQSRSDLSEDLRP